MRVVNLVNLQMAIFQGWRGEETLFVAFVAFCKIIPSFGVLRIFRSAFQVLRT